MEICVGTKDQDGWLAMIYCGSWVSLSVLGFQERKFSFPNVARERAEPGGGIAGQA